MQAEAQAGAAIYSRQILSVYDFGVLRLSNSLAWKCPSSLILDFYNAHISTNHLDVGVGTGYFLDKCRFPSAKPRITLLDLNPNSLEATARRLNRYHPTTHSGNVLEPITLDARFDSIALNYVLHCLPGTMPSKAVAFDHLKALLNPGGVLFGTTILGQGTAPNALARRLMRIYNRRGIFSNADDSLADLDASLKARFGESSTQVVGCVAFFTGRG